MMNRITRSGRLVESLWVCALLSFSFLLFRSDTAAGQNQVNTPGGATNRIPKWTNNMTLNNSVMTDLDGKIGIGAATPSALLNLRVDWGDVIQRFSNAGNIGGELDLRYKYESSQHRIGFTDSNGNWLFYSHYADPNTGSVGYFPGNVGIGTTSTGNYKLKVVGSANVTVDLVVDGNIAAKYQDVAEWVPASRAISAGTVVVLDAER